MEFETMMEEANKSEFENLPQHIIHHIMNFVPYKEAAKLSVLSKTLHSMWLSFPVLDFEWDNSSSGQRKDPNHTFLSSIFPILHSRCPYHMHNSLQRLRVNYKEGSRNDPFLFHIVYELLNIAIKNNAKEIIFDISQKDYIYMRVCSLNSLFESQFLTVLKLKGFRFPIADSIILCPKLINLTISDCPGLRTLTVSSLSVEKVAISGCRELEGVILNGKNLMNFCFSGINQPCDINVSACETIKRMSLHYLTKATKQLMDVVTDRLVIEGCEMPENLACHNPSIKVLDMKNNRYLKNLFLLATNLERFVFSSLERCSVDFSACVALKILELEGVTLKDEYVRSTISHLGCLVELTISDCDELEKMEFKNEKLEKLSLKGCSNLKELIVDAPNLHTFDYDGSPQVYPMQILSTKFHTANIILPTRNIDPPLWYGNMKQFLSCFDQIKDLSIVCCCQTKDLIFPAMILKNDASPLRETKLTKITTKGTIYGRTLARLVDSILWLVHKPLELKLVMPDSTGTLKFEYGKIVKRTKLRKVEERCCLGTSAKCWRHYALKVDIQGFNASHRMNLDKLIDSYISS